MACLNADGTLTASARAILNALAKPASDNEIAKQAGLPPFRVRSGLREMMAAGMAMEKDNVYALTPLGKEKTDFSTAGNDSL